LAERSLFDLSEAIAKGLFEVDETLADGKTKLHMLIENKVKDTVNFSLVLSCLNEKGAPATSTELDLWLYPQNADHTINITKFSFWRNYDIVGESLIGDADHNRVDPDKMKIFALSSLYHLTQEQIKELIIVAAGDFLGRTFLGFKPSLLTLASDMAGITRWYYRLIFSEYPLSVGVHYNLSPASGEHDTEEVFDLAQMNAARSRFLRKCGMPDPL